MKNPIRTALDTLTTPDLPTATSKAEAARQAVIEAHQIVEQAEATLAQADEVGQGQEKAEAALLVARSAAQRVERALAVAERRLDAAAADHEATARAEGMTKLRAATELHLAAARRADAAVRALASAVADMDASDLVVIEAQRNRVASSNASAGHTFGSNVTRRRLELALNKADVFVGHVPQDLESLTEWSAKLGELVAQP